MQLPPMSVLLQSIEKEIRNVEKKPRGFHYLAKQMSLIKSERNINQMILALIYRVLSHKVSNLQNISCSLVNFELL